MQHTRALKTATVLVSILLTLGLLEVASRVVCRLTKRDITRYQPTSAYNVALADARRFISHPFLPFAPRPADARTIKVYRAETARTYAMTYKLNVLGFRTPDRPFTKPAHVKRIVCLGGSTTFDGFTDTETWPALLEAKLNAAARAGAGQVEVINLGMDNATSAGSFIRA